MSKTYKKTKRFKDEKICRLVNRMAQSMKDKEKVGWKTCRFEFNEEFTEVQVFYEKTVEK